VGDLLRRMISAADADQQRVASPPWLWHGYLGPGKVTLLTSQWKSGKTTLVSLLLARLQCGGELAGLPVTRSKALVISEESPADWLPRFQRLGIREHVHLLCRPFPTKPSREQWLTLIEAAAALHERQASELVVIDSLAHFLPGHSENSAGGLLECLTPLQQLATAGMSLLLVHHPRKGKTLAGQAARGSGALAGFVDILIEMGYHGDPDDLDRRRRLVAFSRHEQTPRHLLIELAADGRDYVVRQGGVDAALGESWQATVDVLTVAHRKLTRQEILDGWPPDYPKPDATTLWRWLRRALAKGVVRQEGTGRPGDPVRYWLPAREDLMRPDGGTREEMQAWNKRLVAEALGQGPSGPAPAQEAPVSGETDPAALVSALEGSTGDRPPAARPPACDTTPPAPVPLPSPTVESPGRRTPEAAARLPFPFNLMNPAKIPEEIWQRARAGKRG